MANRTFARLFITSLTAGLFAACGGEVKISSQGTPADAGKTCTYNGHTYVVGATFGSADACNTCDCTTSGSVACTQLSCISQGTGGDASSDASAADAGCHGLLLPPDAGTCPLGTHLQVVDPDAGATGSTSRCVYALPPPDGMTHINETTFSVWLYYSNSTKESVPYMVSSVDCNGPNGGFYFDDPNAQPYLRSVPVLAHNSTRLG